MRRLIIVGSPRTSGRSAHLAEMLFEANIDEHPEDELFLVPVSEVEIGPCIGCNACRKKSGVILKDENGQELTVQKHRCVFDDDMQTLYDLLDDAEEVIVVAPVYFSGAPAPLKCVLDRLQPYFWARMELKQSGAPLPEKRPLVLHVLGEGGDPHGYGALVSEVRSSFATADFRLERVLDWVGKISAEGEIEAEAVEVPIEEICIKLDGAAAPSTSESNASKPRPKLNLHSGIRDSQADAEQSGKGHANARKGANPSQSAAKKPSQSQAKPKQPSKGQRNRQTSRGQAPTSGKQGKRRGK